MAVCDDARFGGAATFLNNSDPSGFSRPASAPAWEYQTLNWQGLTFVPDMCKTLPEISLHRIEEPQKMHLDSNIQFE